MYPNKPSSWLFYAKSKQFMSIYGKKISNFKSPGMISLRESSKDFSLTLSQNVEIIKANEGSDWLIELCLIFEIRI